MFSMTLDNASTNDVLQNTLKIQLLLQNGLIVVMNSFMFWTKLEITSNM